MTRDEAAELLGIVKASPYVRSAWADKLRQCHADTSADGTSNAEHIAKLTAARDLLLQTEVEPCGMCKGVGQVRQRLGMVTCTGCRGTGDKT